VNFINLVEETERQAEKILILLGLLCIRREEKISSKLSLSIPASLPRPFHSFHPSDKVSQLSNPSHFSSFSSTRFLSGSFIHWVHGRNEEVKREREREESE
jgi:hypothetical protein